MTWVAEYFPRSNPRSPPLRGQGEGSDGAGADATGGGGADAMGGGGDDATGEVAVATTR
jgi:hypothetical protein